MWEVIRTGENEFGFRNVRTGCWLGHNCWGSLQVSSVKMTRSERFGLEPYGQDNSAQGKSCVFLLRLISTFFLL